MGKAMVITGITKAARLCWLFSALLTQKPAGQDWPLLKRFVRFCEFY